MDNPLEITIWDYDADRIAAIDRNLCRALQKHGRQGKVTCMSEPPLLVRVGVIHRVPLLEIGGMYWSLTPGEEISEAACDQLLAILLAASADN